MVITEQITSKLPYSKPFLFVDELISVDESGAEGSYTFDPELDFYQGHFKGYPVTPGVILTECMAQIGVVTLGIFLLGDKFGTESKIAMTSTDINFLTAVFPGEKVTVRSKKEYFRFGKLKCKVSMTNSEGKEVCRGIIAGMIIPQNNG